MFDVHKYINTAFRICTERGKEEAHKSQVTSEVTKGRRFEGSSEEEQNSFLWSIPRNKAECCPAVLSA
jgi:hypothetical protein